MIMVNGEPRPLVEPLTVADLVPADARGLAVALNGVVVPRGAHATTTLADGDLVEIVTAVQGG